MSKDSHFTGQPVYSQVLKLLDKEKILQISRETKGSEAYVKRFDGYQHLVVMLFGILKHFASKHRYSPFPGSPLDSPFFQFIQRTREGFE